MSARAKLPSWKNSSLISLYFGGGTPSLFTAQSLGRVLDHVRSLWATEASFEVTVEINPGTVDFEKLERYREHGINRLSIGSQTLNPRILAELGRAHTVEDTERTIHAAQEAGFSNISLDLMFGVQGQTKVDLRGDLQRFIAHSPTHISAYGLTIEKGTPFFSRFERGTLQLPRDEECAEMMELLIDTLSAAGFIQYEISNFAQKGFESRHNSSYWSRIDYLGVGAGAHSFSTVEGGRFGRRWSNYTAPLRYMESIRQSGYAESWSDALSEEGAIFEYFFLGLRKLAGVSMREFQQTFKLSCEGLFGDVIQELVEQKLMTLEGDILRVSREGVLLFDSILENFAEPTLQE